MDDPDNFLTRYEAHLAYSNKRYAHRQPIRLVDWNVYAEHYIDHRVEQYMEVTIPQHRLQELIERDRYFNEMVKRHDYAQMLLAERTIEDTIRRQNPAVEKAWRNYQLLLEMART